MHASLSAIEVGAQRDAEAAFILLHGLGADGHDFEPVARQLAEALPLPIRFILPHAPVRPVTVNQGMSMPAWYDILSMENVREVDWAGLDESRQVMIRRVEALRAEGITRVIMGGFSQGAALSLYTGLSGKVSLEGIVALSGYYPSQESGSLVLSDTPPVFMAHGVMDPVVPIALARSSQQQLRSLGVALDYHEYLMPHSVCAEEIEALEAWLRRQLCEN